MIEVSNLSYREVLLALRDLNDVHSRRERWSEENKITYGQICKRLREYGNEDL